MTLILKKEKVKIAVDTAILCFCQLELGVPLYASALELTNFISLFRPLF